MKIGRLSQSALTLALLLGVSIALAACADGGAPASQGNSTPAPISHGY